MTPIQIRPSLSTALSIKRMIIVVIAGMMLAVLLVGSVALYTAQRTVGLMEHEVMQAQALQLQLSELTLKMEYNRSQVLQALQHLPGTAFEKLHDHPLQVHLTEIGKNSSALTQAWRTFRAGLPDPETARLADAWHARSGGLGLSLTAAAAAAIENGAWDDAEHVLIRQINPTFRQGAPARQQLHDFLLAAAERGAAAAHATMDRQRLILVITMLACAVLGGLMGRYLLKGIQQPMQQAVALARRVAQGQLAVPVEREARHEFGALQEALGAMQASLAEVVGQVRGGADSIVAATHQIAAGNADLSGRTERQAAVLEHTAQSVTVLADQVRQNADHARSANDMVRAAAGFAQRGGSAVDGVVATMDSIAQSSTRIADIVGVIDGIAFQTNILALNAAVEAARAGDGGRGFAVVASEVRALAQRSAVAAREIKSLIGESVDRIGNGTQLVREAGGTMADILRSIEQAATLMAQIAGASAQQHSGIEQMRGTLVELDAATQHNAALVEESAAAAAQLAQQASQLRQLVSVFQLADSAAPERPRLAA
ncbi:methyl-accepting chemotaxis protein [Massilia sp. SM-13]|uniref:methyl-accepting chemotaxis protein n=1 Tax=Pseudoduganella rhizocola TaxID=3382643 RepID=UPI0038B69E21